MQPPLTEATAVRFSPWIGSRYATEGFNGLRVLLVCESHYGERRYERQTVTPEIVKALALGETHPKALKKLPKHRHFAKILAAVNNATRSGAFSAAQRRDFWSKVAYFNFLQEFMPAPRKDPPAGAWARGALAYREVAAVLQPELVVCFSSRNGDRIKALVGAVPVAVVNHPSSQRFSYARVNPIIRSAMETALAEQSSQPLRLFVASQNFLNWKRATEVAPAAAGPYLPADELAQRLITWQGELAELDRMFANTTIGGNLPSSGAPAAARAEQA